MLFDRFDNMRSKVISGGGEGGYDLTRIGSSVSVNARTSLSIGSAFEGEKNDEFYTKSFKQSAVGINDISQISTDRKVIVTSNSYSSNTISIYMLNSQGQYQLVSINDSIIGSTPKMNSKGTMLICNSTNSGKVVIIEINKENLTLSAYEATATMTNIPPIENVFLNENANKLFIWDFETHTIHESTNTISFQGNYWVKTTNKIISFSSNNVLTFMFLLESYGSTYISKFEVDLITYAVTYSHTLIRNTGSNLSPFFSIDENFILCYDTTHIYIYSFNKYTTNFTLQHTINISDLGISSNLDYQTLLSLDNNILQVNNDYFDVTDWNNITLITTSSLITYSSIQGIIQWKTFIENSIIKSSSTNYFVGFPNDSTSHYYIEPYSGTLQAGKIYGITSKALRFGENGNAQMLFSSYPIVP